MSESMYQVEIEKAKSYLYQLIVRQALPEGKKWLDGKLQQLSSVLGAADAERAFYMAFSSVPRFVGKAKIQFTLQDLQEAEALRTGFDPSAWTLDETARVLLLLSLPHTDMEAYTHTLTKLFTSADVNESVALYSSLPLLPHPEAHHDRAAEGLRSNMSVVFEAIVLHNPYPANYLSENAWNQLFMKSIFTDKPVYKIYGVDQRVNAHLARIASDFAHERWAAGRVVTPELWRVVGSFMDETSVHDIKKLFGQSEVIQHEAAALACSQSTLPEARQLLQARPDLKSQVEGGLLSWQIIGAKWEASRAS